jgi:hypothetical protein
MALITNPLFDKFQAPFRRIATSNAATREHESIERGFRCFTLERVEKYTLELF